MDIEEVWSNLLQQLKSPSTVSASQIDAFFSRVKIQAVSSGFIMITSREPFIKDWVETHYKEDIRQALTTLYGGEWLVQIELDATGGAPEEPAKPTLTPKPEPIEQEAKEKAPSTQEEKPAAVTPQPEPEPEPESVPATLANRTEEGAPSLTFESFVMGDSNRMAYSMAVEVADKPGRSALNPLFIYGRSGVGKTHLLCAIKHYIENQYPSMRVRYIDSMQMVNEYSNAAMNKDFKGFEESFRDLDVLLIDDIQGLQGKQGTLNTLFGLFNELIPKGKQFVFSADRAPKNIDLDERYVSRFNSGATIDVQPPDTETKRNIIKSFIKECQTEEDFTITIDDDVLDFVAENSSSNVRELKSAVTNIVFMMKIDPAHTITRQKVRELLANHFISESSMRITTEQIQQAVADFYGVSLTDMLGKGRSKAIKYPRQVAIYLCREMLETTFNAIGSSFNRSHATIMHSYDLISNQMKEDRNLHEEIEAIREKLRTQQY